MLLPSAATRYYNILWSCSCPEYVTLLVLNCITLHTHTLVHQKWEVSCRGLGNRKANREITQRLCMTVALLSAFCRRQTNTLAHIAPCSYLNILLTVSPVGLPSRLLFDSLQGSRHSSFFPFPPSSYVSQALPLTASHFHHSSLLLSLLCHIKFLTTSWTNFHKFLPFVYVVANCNVCGEFSKV